VKFNYDLSEAPSGKTLQLLNTGKAVILGEIGSPKRAREMGIIAWALPAERDKDEEIKRGYTPASKAG